MAVDPDQLAAIEEALKSSGRVDPRRIALSLRDDAVVLMGAVAEPEEAEAAGLVAEQYADKVINELRIDRGLQEGVAEPVDVERAEPAENEILIGSTDMLAGPESEITSDMARAFQENEPWDPPDTPHLASPAAAHWNRESLGDAADADAGDPDPDAVSRADYSAPDLTQADLEAAARGAPVPSLDPSAVAPGPVAEPDPIGVDELGRAPDDEALRPMADQVPGTPQGPGAVGEPTTEGGSPGLGRGHRDGCRGSGHTGRRSRSPDWRHLGRYRHRAGAADARGPSAARGLPYPRVAPLSSPLPGRPVA